MDDIKALLVKTIKVKPDFTEANFEAARKAGATLEQIKSKYNLNLYYEIFHKL